MCKIFDRRKEMPKTSCNVLISRYDVWHSVRVPQLMTKLFLTSVRAWPTITHIIIRSRVQYSNNTNFQNVAHSAKCDSPQRSCSRLLACEEDLKSGMEEWGVMMRVVWVDGTDGRSAIHKSRWVRIGEISAWLTERSRKLIPETVYNWSQIWFFTVFAVQYSIISNHLVRILLE